MPTALAMAIRCSTALVDPPSAMTSVIALSKAARVMMSRGLMSRFINSRMALRMSLASEDKHYKAYLPATEHSTRFSGSSAGTLEL